MSQLRETVTSHSLFTSTRLYSLYSDFKKLKEINPEGYEANIIAWRSLISQFFKDGHLKHNFILDTEGLQNDLTISNYGKPLGLATVLEELISDGDLLPLDQFIQSDGVYKTKWVKPALRWVVNRYLYDTSYKMSDRKGELKIEKLVSLKALEEFKAALQSKLSIHETKTDNLFTRTQFKKYLNSLEMRNSILTDLDIDVLLNYLQRDVKLITVHNDVIKLGTEEVTEEDNSILEIKSSINKLSEGNELLEKKIETTSTKLKSLISNKNYNKDLALNLLKSKKLAESSLTKQINSLNQLESVLFKINESKTNLEVINSLKSSTGILSSLNSQIGDVEAVEAVMDELQTETEKVDQTTQMLSDLNVTDQVDDDEIEDEFQQLLKEELANKKRKGEGHEPINNSKVDAELFGDHDQEGFADAVNDDSDVILERFKKLKLSPSDIKDPSNDEHGGKEQSPKESQAIPN